MVATTAAGSTIAAALAGAGSCPSQLAVIDDQWSASATAQWRGPVEVLLLSPLGVARTHQRRDIESRPWDGAVQLGR